MQAAFVEGRQQRFPADFFDGTSNTILIVEAGQAVPWTKPEELPFAAGKPLPELGGLFRDVFQAAFASGDVAVLTKKYDEQHLRYAITSNGGDVINYSAIEAPPRDDPPPRRGDPAAAEWRRKNDEARQEIKRAREHLRLLEEEREAQRELSGEGKNQPPYDPHLDQLKRENALLEEELRRLHADSEELAREIARAQKPARKKGP
jgi:hypothetical protein